MLQWRCAVNLQINVLCTTKPHPAFHQHGGWVDNDRIWALFLIYSLEPDSNCTIIPWDWCETPPTSTVKASPNQRCASVACRMCNTTADRTSCSADLWGAWGVSCDFVLCCGVVRCGEDGPCLPKRLWRRRETAVNLVVAADGVWQLRLTTPGRGRLGPSTVAWPFWKPPAYYVITSYWAL